MAERRPNVLIIVTDQQRADTIAALGNSVIKTPALDGLVRAGTSFTRAYTPAPICSPTRVSMVTGLPPHVHRFTDHDWWHHEPEDDPPSPAPHDSPFMKLLHDEGYQTFMTGKLHHSGRGWLTDGVEEYAGREPVISQDTEVVASYGEFLKEKGYPEWLPPSDGVGSEYYMVPQVTSAPPEHSRSHWLADRCIDFLRRRDGDRPFLLHCHFPEPHPPIVNPMPWALLYRANEMDAPYRPDDYESYQSRTNRYQNRYKCRETAQEDDIGYRIIKAAYYGSISLIDHSIGRILDALRDEREDTLILFTTDHGELLGDYGCVGKRCMLEAALRIPLVLAWPGRVPASNRCDVPVSLMDMYETVLDAVGVEGEKRSEEGRSLLRAAERREGDRIVFSQFSSGWCGQYAATDGRWKYAYSAPDDREWLFEVGDDLAEGPNRLDDPEVAGHVERLKGALLRRHDPALDPFSDAVEGDDWKKHDPPPEDYLDDPICGFLWQERGPDELQAAVNKLGPGYARKVTRDQSESLHHAHAVCGGESPFEE
ncbi:MAG: sulfatase-like hydrolase/transferase [Candidatus Brocadiia bacterium]